MLAPTGQLVWTGPAQLGLDGLAYDPHAPAKTPSEPEGEGGGSDPSPRQLWLKEVEKELEPILNRVAGNHRYEALEARKEGDLSRANWHEVRAEGSRERFDRLRRCLWREVHRVCVCGFRRKIPLRCSDWRLCLHCRDKRAAYYRRKVKEARARVLKQYQMVLRKGLWQERFLTLTGPHSGHVGRDIGVLRRAWSDCLRRIKRHLSVDRGIPKNMLNFPWVRVVECTCGTHGDGHAHLHVYLVSPYLHHVLIRLYWARSLPEDYRRKLPTRKVKRVLEEVEEKAETPEQKKRQREELTTWLVTRRGPHGRRLKKMEYPVIDIRRAEEVEEELVKYLIKDAAKDPTSGKLVYLEPKLYAKIYDGYQGKRAVTASRDFWVPKEKKEHCPDCGCVEWRREVHERAELGGSIGYALAALGAFSVRGPPKGGDVPELSHS